jgi:diaminopimelate epimerase
MRFHKFQALGNDFIIIREEEWRPAEGSEPALVRRLCDRHFGVGADGLEVLLERPREEGADFEFRLFNADGGETPISGNGTRCLAAFLHQAGLWSAPEVRIATGAGVRDLRLARREATRYVFETGMGLPRLSSGQIPVRLPQPLERVVAQPIEVLGHNLLFTSVSLGNPHCSLLVDDFYRLDWRALGAALERHPNFPDQTNVEFIRIRDRREIEVRFWERGVGETLASGTGACAAAIAAMLNDLTERRVNVLTPGGALVVEWLPDGTVRQTGEACAVYSGNWLAEA